MIDTQSLNDDELIDTMAKLQTELDRRYQIEELQGTINRLKSELTTAQAELAQLTPANEATPAPATESSPPPDTSTALPWEASTSYAVGTLVIYKDKIYQAIKEAHYSPAAYPQAWEEVRSKPE